MVSQDGSPDPGRETASAVCRALIFTMKERYGANDRPAVHGNSTQHGHGPAGHRRARLVRRAGPAGRGRSARRQRRTSREPDRRAGRAGHDRDDSRENRDERENFDGRDDREFGESRDERKQHDGEYTEQGSRREQPPALSAGTDAFAPVLEAWKQVFKSWSELAETMVKAQQDAFASMIGAANTTAKDINLGDRRDGEPAFSGSRTTASTPDRIEHDRR